MNAIRAETQTYFMPFLSFHRETAYFDVAVNVTISVIISLTDNVALQYMNTLRDTKCDVYIYLFSD